MRAVWLPVHPRKDGEGRPAAGVSAGFTGGAPLGAGLSAEPTLTDSEASYMPRMTLRPTIRGTRQIVGVVLAAAVMLSAVTEGRQVGAAARGAIVQTPPGRSPGVLLELVREGDFEAVVAAVLAAAGHPRLVVRIRASDNVKTAEAFIEAGRKVIEFNPRFLARLTQRAQTDWSAVLVVSHEVAHLLAGHARRRALSGDDLRRFELEASRAAGVLLGRLGASRDDALRSMRAGCELDGVSKSDCAAYETAVEIGWHGGVPANEQMQPTARRQDRWRACG